MTIHYLYLLKFPGGRCYAGITNNIERRMYEHKKRARQGFVLPVYAAIRKYGEDEFTYEIVGSGTRKEVESLEIELIAKLDQPYNVAPGGAVSPMLSPELQEKARGRKQTPEHIAKRTGTQIGAKRSEESKARMSAGQKTRFRTPEELERVRSMSKGRVVSEEHRRKLSDAAKARWARTHPSPL